MDLRIQRTKRNIFNAFIELRAKKPLEKITITELADLAFINKATFYTHYQDIYDLSEQLEDEAIITVLNDIPHPQNLVLNPKQAVFELHAAMMSQGTLFGILFSGSRQHAFLEKIEKNLKERIFAYFPEYKNNLEKELLLSVLIQGCFRTFLAYETEDAQEVLDILGDINECLMQHYR